MQIKIYAKAVLHANQDLQNLECKSRFTKS